MTVQRGEHEEEITVRLTQPLLAAMVPSEFRERGCRTVRLAHPVSFGTDAEFDVGFIRFLREALSCLLTVDWSLAAAGPIDVAAVCHLPPPTAGRKPVSGAASTASGTASTASDPGSST